MVRSNRREVDSEGLAIRTNIHVVRKFLTVWRLFDFQMAYARNRPTFLHEKLRRESI